MWRAYLSCFIRNRHKTRNTAAMLLLHTLTNYYHNKHIYPSQRYETYLICVATASGASVFRNTAKTSAMFLLIAGTKTHRLEVICDEATITRI